jgi:hypothetical protein
VVWERDTYTMGMVVLVLQSGSRAMMMVVVNKERFVKALDIPLE